MKAPQSNYDKIRAAIVRLNSLYGRGDIVSVKLFMSGRIDITRKPYGRKPEIRRGRLERNTVFAFGHQMQLSS